MSKFCTNCGEALTEGTRFCVKCGAEISADRKEINDVQQYEAVNREPEQDEKLGYEKDFEEYEDEKDNLLLVMSKAKFDDRRAKSGSDKFWGPYYEEMCFKTLVHAAAKKITIDPRKVNMDSLNAVEIDEETVLRDDDQPLGNGAELVLDPEDVIKGKPQTPALPQETASAVIDEYARPYPSAEQEQLQDTYSMPSAQQQAAGAEYSCM